MATLKEVICWKCGHDPMTGSGYSDGITGCKMCGANQTIPNLRAASSCDSCVNSPHRYDMWSRYCGKHDNTIPNGLTCDNHEIDTSFTERNIETGDTDG